MTPWLLHLMRALSDGDRDEAHVALSELQSVIGYGILPKVELVEGAACDDDVTTYHICTNDCGHK